MRSSICFVAPVIGLLVVVVAGCSTDGSANRTAIAGPVVFFDAAGNRMVVDVEAARHPEPDSRRTVADPSGQEPEVVRSAPAEVQQDGAGTQHKPDSAAAATETAEMEMDASGFRDSEEVLAEIRERDQERQKDRFFLVPDGTGQVRTLIGQQGGLSEPSPTAVTSEFQAIQWQLCRIKLPLLELSARKTYRLEFPVRDIEHLYAGYRLVPPAGTRGMELWSYERKGDSPVPLLAELDEEGRVIAVVNNMPTESIPETRFSYARRGGKMIYAAGRKAAGIAVLDRGLIGDRFPEACGVAKLPPGEGTSHKGQVSLVFYGN